MRPDLLVCDLDNTLYDWVSYFVQSFYSMVDEIVVLTKCDREQLLDDFRTVHRKHGDLEHPFALLETNTVRDTYVGRSRKEIADELDPAFKAFNVSRKRTLRVYPGVHESLRELKRAGIEVVAHTESNLFAAVDRLTRLELTDFFKRIYCGARADSAHPDPQARSRWHERFVLDKFIEFSKDQRKPSVRVLLEICKREGILASDTAYVGDSITRDMTMAKQAGVFSIWAKYGTNHNEKDFARLVRITHWTEKDVTREEMLRADSRKFTPNATLENGFGEIKGVISV